MDAADNYDFGLLHGLNHISEESDGTDHQAGAAHISLPERVLPPHPFRMRVIDWQRLQSKDVMNERPNDRSLTNR